MNLALQPLPAHLTGHEIVLTGSPNCATADEIIECEGGGSYLLKSSSITMTRMIPGTKHLPGDNFLWIDESNRKLLLVRKRLNSRGLRRKQAIKDLCFHSGRLLNVLYCLTGCPTRESVEGSICAADGMDQTQLW